MTTETDMANFNIFLYAAGQSEWDRGEEKQEITNSSEFKMICDCVLLYEEYEKKRWLKKY